MFWVIFTAGTVLPNHLIHLGATHERIGLVVSEFFLRLRVHSRSERLTVTSWGKSRQWFCLGILVRRLWPPSYATETVRRSSCVWCFSNSSTSCWDNLWYCLTHQTMCYNFKQGIFKHTIEIDDRLYNIRSQKECFSVVNNWHGCKNKLTR